MTTKLLILNGGSSSFKCSYFVVESSNHFRCLKQKSLQWTDQFSRSQLAAAVAEVVDGLEIDGIVHRIVHGGEHYTKATLIDAAVIQAITALIPLAPLHHPVHLAGIALCQELWPNLPEIAVFDTAFHAQIPAVAATYPIPYRYKEQGLKRYGFHGLSHHGSLRKMANLLDRPMDSFKLISCHLGNGCSMAAIRGGHSIDTTMGYTPLEGLMMGTRSGSIDPGLLIHLQKEAVDLEQLLSKESGLKGVFGPSGDMRTVLQAMSEGNQRAKLAFDMFVYRIQMQIGAYWIALQGADALSFTGGIGENSPLVRQAICAALLPINGHLDSKKNESGTLDSLITGPNSGIAIGLIHAEEDEEMVREACSLVLVK